MDPLPDAKPQCGGGQEPGEYDLPLHVAALFMVLTASIFGAGFPVVAKKVKWLKVPPKVFFACKHFGTGVLVATAFVHLLPTAFASLTDPCLPDLFTDQYPAMPGVIMMAAMFALFTVEMYLHAKTGGHSHGGPTGDVTAHRPRPTAVQQQQPPVRPARPFRNTFDADDEESLYFEKKVAMATYNQEKGERYPYVNDAFRDPNNVVAPPPDSEMPPWFVVFYEQYVRQRLEMMNMINASQAQMNEKSAASRVSVVPVPAIEGHLDAEGQMVDPAVYRKMSMNITLLEGGILFHSIFVGITISLTIDGFIILVVAIIFHQMFEGLGLGSRIAEVPYPQGSVRPWLLVVAFGTTAPIGQAIGLVARGSYDPSSAFGLIIVGVFNAISSGLLLYAALVDLLAEDFLSEEADLLMTKKDKRVAFAWVLLGAAGMSVVGAFA